MREANESNLPHRNWTSRNSAADNTVELIDRLHADWTLNRNGPNPGGRSFLFDGLGSVCAVTDGTTSNVVDTFKYDPYGNSTASTGSTYEPIRYAGGYLDTHQDGNGPPLYKFGQRYYDPGIGRWTQRDPLDNPLDLHGWNGYIYAGDDPINLTDPTGITPFGRCNASYPESVPWVSHDHASCANERRNVHYCRQYAGSAFCHRQWPSEPVANRPGRWSIDWCKVVIDIYGAFVQDPTLPPNASQICDHAPVVRASR
jgi:RHS repeat-associated protein